MEDLKHKWEQIDEDDYVAKYRDMMLRVEKMGKKWLDLDGNTSLTDTRA